MHTKKKKIIDLYAKLFLYFTYQSQLALFIGLNAYMYVSHEKKEWSNNFFFLNCSEKNCLSKDAETFIFSQKALFVVCQTIFLRIKF